MSETILPLKIESTPNQRVHWAKRAAKAKTLRMAGLAVPRHPLPCRVLITRIAPRKLDDDNMIAGCKALRDGIADRLGIKDNDPRVAWLYAQERGKPKEYAVRVRFLDAERHPWKGEP